MIKVCPVCGREFETNKKNKKYCSYECAHEATYIRQLKYHQMRRATDPAFKAKQDEWNRKYRERNPNPKKERRYKTCIVCGKEIPESRSKCAKTCSPECAKIRHTQITEQWHKMTPMGVDRKKTEKVEQEPTDGMIINPVCGVPCTECDKDYCPF